MKQRNITLKPTVTHFGPLTGTPTEMLQLNEEELEALYLADFQGYYQEDSAQKLGVSRPTFAKIIKRARKKVTEMLMYGKGIELTSKLEEFVVIYPTDDRITVSPYFLVAKLFAFAEIKNGSIYSISYLSNPVYDQLNAKGIPIVDDESASGMAAGRLIPPLFKKGNLLVTQSLGEGMQRNLEGIGLNIEFTNASHIDTVLQSLL